LNECLARTNDATRLLLKLERSGHTRNDRYYYEYKEKFLSYFKIQRELASGNTVLRDLGHMASPNETQPHTPFVTQVNLAKAALVKAGFPQIDDLQLAKLIPPQASDSALEDMARASAGFEGASLPSCIMEPFLTIDY
jgi:hypothetical protein